MAERVGVHGLKETRAAFRALGREVGANRDLSRALKEAMGPVTVRARELAPHRTGRLAASIRPFAVGRSVGVRSRLPYANVIQWGGNVPNRESRSTRPKRHFEASHFATRAVEGQEGAITESLGRAIDRAAERHGFH